METHKNNSGRAVIYCRTNQSAQSGLARQEALCRGVAEQQGLEVAAVFSDVGSGVAPYLPGVLAMLDWVKCSGAPAPVVLVEDVTRVSRSVSQFFAIKRQLAKCGSAILPAYVHGPELDRVTVVFEGATS